MIQVVLVPRVRRTASHRIPHPNRRVIFGHQSEHVQLFLDVFALRRFQIVQCFDSVNLYQFSLPSFEHRRGPFNR